MMYLALVVVLAVLSTAFSANMRKEVTAVQKQKHIDALMAHLASKPRRANPLTKGMKANLAKNSAISTTAVHSKTNRFKKSDHELDNEIFFTGNYAYIHSMTHSDTKLEKRHKRCRANLDMEQVWETHAMPLGCRGDMGILGSSIGLGCFVNRMTNDTELIMGTWMNSPNCNSGLDGFPQSPPDEEVSLFKEPRCFQDMDYFGPNPEDAFGGPINYSEMSPEDREKFPWSLQKAACGTMPAPFPFFSGIVEVDYSNAMNCVMSQISTASTIWGHMHNSCIDTLITDDDSDAKNWISYKVEGCTEPTDTMIAYGLGGSKALLGLFEGKGCREGKRLYSYNDLPASLFLGIPPENTPPQCSNVAEGVEGEEESHFLRAYCLQRS